MADTTLKLGDFVFAGLEIPESLPLGGGQRLAVHNFPGGARNVQAMGFDHAPVSWQGLFLGPNALDRAKVLDAMRVKGAAILLTCFTTSLRVVIEKFEFKAERFYKVPYSINVIVVEDLSQSVAKTQKLGFDTAIRLDVASMVNGGLQIGDLGLNTALGTLSSAVGAVSNFATATTAGLQSVLGPISSVLSVTDTLIASVKNTMGSVTTLGGIIPGNPISTQVSAMLGQVSASSQYPILENIRSMGVRMGLNIANVQGSSQSITVAGGTLFDVASKQYGDPTQWTAIAKASGLLDPVLNGVKSLNLPVNPLNSGGVPGQ